MFENLNPAFGDLGPTEAFDQLFTFATEHGTAYYLDPTRFTVYDLHATPFLVFSPGRDKLFYHTPGLNLEISSFGSVFPKRVGSTLLQLCQVAIWRQGMPGLCGTRSISGS